MNINGTPHIHGPHGINAPHAPFRNHPTQASTAAQPVDRVEISPAAQAASQASETGEIRQGLVDNIRAQIAAGTYETPGRIGIAIDRLLDEIG